MIERALILDCKTYDQDATDKVLEKTGPFDPRYLAARSLVWTRGFTAIGYVPESREIYQKEPVMPLFFFRSFIIFYLQRFTILNEDGLLTDGDTSKSHDSPTTFKMALYSWPKF